MSVHLQVFLKADKLPSHGEWQAAIDAEKLDLTLDDADTTTHQGFWPCKLDGIDCGFEYFFGNAEPIGNDKLRKATNGGFWARLLGTEDCSKPDEPDEIQKRIGIRDHVVEFAWHSSLNDGRAAAFASAVLAKISDGFLFDPQSGELTSGTDAIALVRSQDRTEHTMKMEQAVRKWGTATLRRCPKCSAPCPEYRPRCFVCNYEIGRA